MHCIALLSIVIHRHQIKIYEQFTSSTRTLLPKLILIKTALAHQGQIVKNPSDLTQDKQLEFCNFSVRFSVYIAGPSVMSLSNLKLKKPKALNIPENLLNTSRNLTTNKRNNTNHLALYFSSMNMDGTFLLLTLAR